MTTILHITTRAGWEAAQQAGSYRGDTLDTEGFIHCSIPQQVVRTANAFFHGQNDLVLLLINPQKLRSELRYEPSDGDLFPHIYGPLNLDAVVRVVMFPPRNDGQFELPHALNNA